MNKPLLLIAIVLFLFYIYALYEWLQSNHSFEYVWRAATSDWFLAITLFDLLLFGLLCLIWLTNDMRSRHYSVIKIILILLACLISGVPVVLTYLAFRKDKRVSS